MNTDLISNKSSFTQTSFLLIRPLLLAWREKKFLQINAIISFVYDLTKQMYSNISDNIGFFVSNDVPSFYRLPFLKRKVFIRVLNFKVQFNLVHGSAEIVN